MCVFWLIAEMAATQLTSSPVTVSARSFSELRVSSLELWNQAPLSRPRAASVVAPKVIILTRIWLNMWNLSECCFNSSEKNLALFYFYFCKKAFIFKQTMYAWNNHKVWVEKVWWDIPHIQPSMSLQRRNLWFNGAVLWDIWIYCPSALVMNYKSCVIYSMHQLSHWET